MLYKIDQRVVVLMAAVFFSGPVAAHAMEPKKSTFSMGTELSYVTYKESGVKETGPFYGLIGSYVYRGELFNESFSSAMLKVEGRVSLAKVDYDGMLLDGSKYKIKNISDFLGEFRGLAGYDFPIFSSSVITPFTGLGFRFLKDDLSKDNAGYRRQSNYLYSPIGIESKTSLADGWSAGVNAEYDIFWLGWQITSFSDLDPLFGDVTNDQKKGYGFKGSIKIKKEMEDKNFVFEPYLNYWNIGRSQNQPLKYSGTIIGTAWEPKNTSTEFGIKMGVEF